MTLADEENELQAVAFSNSHKWLYQRLSEARSCLRTDLRRKMAHGEFDYTNKRLVSQCGKYWLQWQTREQPDKEPSYNNQQTTAGCVTFHEHA